ncbi:hypothetical protein JZO73_08080 [Enterococcus plantarum]|uniref:hypothetical protein n=1 Tax=Enterococcus plantarum TaxID=1077675 RepID=UPI001A8D6B1D|nr:hypothetical protein [Enterococcus plantarum]MBO0467494.1 hypothetical protein [Enterococcus plantarum]
MENKQSNYNFLRVLLRLGWYGTFLCQAIMVLLWISSFLSKDSSFYFKVNLITGVLIFLINYFLLKSGWSEVTGWNSYYKLYIVTGLLMVINILCLPVGIVYILIPIYMKHKDKEQIRNEVQKEQGEEGEF